MRTPLLRSVILLCALLVLPALLLLPGATAAPSACLPGEVVCASVDTQDGVCTQTRTGDLEDPRTWCSGWPQGSVPDWDVCTPTWTIPAPQAQACTSRDNTWYCYSARVGTKYLANKCFQFIGP